ncbi:helix-turn-helix domain-containing protein [Sphingobium sufflavum]|jgi:IclR family transcriptional regulator, mhp operon transcriptional activator|uniref:helix-turn-helix domain-containing protein n=1 Tax=Sphingobium sufflavum TaxID=1129547 RepID=UPI001F42F7DB|nr:helix-turn-helix domain-containing protein [Sphingobium sufflavum]MCE7796471.1 helix-turn-helix domain-containing protein [Sphingobium sufflavum]
MKDKDQNLPERGVPIRSLSRGIAVLQAINRQGSLSMMEISRLSGLPYPTAYRLVQTLVYEGLVECEPSRRHYRPTGMVQTLAHGFQGDSRLVQASRPHIVELTRRVNWPITLSTHVGYSMVIRDSTHSISALTFNEYHPGFATPMLESASGLAYLSAVPDDERVSLMDGMKQIPNKRWAYVIDLIENGGLLEEIQQRRIAARGFNQFTRNPGKTSSMATVVMDGDRPAGTISLAFFSSAMKMQDAMAAFADLLLATAQTIREDLSQIPR